MSTELYEVLALASRYLFVLLGILIVIRAFFWLLADRSERRRRLRSLPNAGFIGEFVVITGGTHLPEGSSVAIPWEGVLGSVRTADVFIPCDGVSRNHLDFHFDPSKGLLVHPRSGEEILANGISLNCHSRTEDMPLTHGSFLQAGSALLRLRVFAGLDPAAGFADDADTPAMPAPSSQGSEPPETRLISQQISMPSRYPAPQSAEQMIFPPENAVVASPLAPQPLSPEIPFNPVIDVPSPESSAESAASPRRRRSGRWEVDWSE